MYHPSPTVYKTVLRGYRIKPFIQMGACVPQLYSSMHSSGITPPPPPTNLYHRRLSLRSHKALSFSALMWFVVRRSGWDNFTYAWHGCPYSSVVEIEKQTKWKYSQGKDLKRYWQPNIVCRFWFRHGQGVPQQIGIHQLRASTKQFF